MASAYPYEAVCADQVIELSGRRFRVLVAGWRHFKGLPRSDMGGLAILDEDNHLVIADAIAAEDPDSARFLFESLLKQDLLYLVHLVNGAERCRFYLTADGHLLDKLSFPEGPPHVAAGASPLAE